VLGKFGRLIRADRAGSEGKAGEPAQQLRARRKGDARQRVAGSEIVGQGSEGGSRQTDDLAEVLTGDGGGAGLVDAARFTEQLLVLWGHGCSVRDNGFGMQL
jgi:hypothetical protein